MFGAWNELDRWTCKLIDDIADVTVGVVIKPAQYYTELSNGVRAFRSLNVGEMHVRDDNWVYFTPEGHKVNKKSELRAGDVLVVRSGYPGTSCVVTGDYAGSNAIDIIIVRPDATIINSVYLCAFTNFWHGKNQIQKKIGGAAQQHFNIGAYREMTIALPPLSLQNQFAAFVKQADKLKFAAYRSAANVLPQNAWFPGYHNFSDTC
jgi:type I restriction enzyme S subunit